MISVILSFQSFSHQQTFIHPKENGRCTSTQSFPLSFYGASTFGVAPSSAKSRLLWRPWSASSSLWSLSPLEQLWCSKTWVMVPLVQNICYLYWVSLIRFIFSLPDSGSYWISISPTAFVNAHHWCLVIGMVNKALSSKNNNFTLWISTKAIPSICK